MHSYRVWITTEEGKRIAEHTFQSEDDIEAVKQAGSLISAGQAAQVRSKDRLVAIIEAPSPIRRGTENVRGGRVD